VRSATPLDALDATSAGEIAKLCRRALPDPPDAGEILGCLFARDEPACVRGDPTMAVVATSVQENEANGEVRGFVKLLVVDPAYQRRGHGHDLLEAAERDLATASTITIGADAPYYLFPGVELSWTAMQCLLERFKYQRTAVNFDMMIDLSTLGGVSGGGAKLATEDDRSHLASFMDTHWRFWKKEVMRALDKSMLLVAEDEDGISGFCALDVNRHGVLGPVAVRPDLMGKGVGARILDAAVVHLREQGRSRVKVSWVSVISAYARLGGKIAEAYIVYEKRPKATGAEI
jgi:GNAT superfamily N-acetyltransferase